MPVYTYFVTLHLSKLTFGKSRVLSILNTAIQQFLRIRVEKLSLKALILRNMCYLEFEIFQVAVQGQNSKNLCCLCCKSGPIAAQFHIDRAGYVPGDTVYLNAEINNNSSRRMRASRVKLIMVCPKRYYLGLEKDFFSSLILKK